MNYDYYRVFHAVAKRGSLTRAAEELYTSQPAITRTIKNLESELGVKLFTRSKKGVTLTKEGELLYSHVSAAYAMISKAESELSSSLTLQSGSITLGATITALDECLFDLLEKFKAAHPSLKFKIVSRSSDATIAMLRSGEVDLAFVTTPYKKVDDVIEKKLKSFDNIFICGAGYPELLKGIHSLSELATYPLVYLSTVMQLRQYCDETFAAHGISVTPSIELDSASTVLPMVEKNLGIGIVPRSIAAEAIKLGHVHEIKTKEPLPKRDVVLLKSAVYPETAPVRRFAEFALSEYPD
ncbi:MAG: LysR family transcriptional regulator [Bacilli bacterium]|nr:LysR family transcriptional regulator [Bacilli bacterium]